MPNEAEIRALARGVLQTRTLPRHDPDRTWGGPGVDKPCTICGLRIPADTTEYELQFRNGQTADLDRFHLHLRCFAVWELERTKV
jgi:hypothetical protein